MKASTDVTLLHAFVVSFKVQRIFCISAFKLHNNQLISTAGTMAYSYTLLCSYFLCMCMTSYVVWTVSSLAEIVSQHGYLWLFVWILDLIFTKFTYIFMIICSELNKRNLIRFYEKMLAIDEVFRLRFGTTFNYGRLRWKNLLIIGLCLLYSEGMTAFVTYKMWQRNFFPKLGLLLFALSYQFDQMAINLNTWVYMSNVAMIRCRFKRLQEVTQAMHNRRKIIQSLKYGTGHEVTPLKSGLLVYKQLLNVVTLLNENSELILVRFIHDFIVTTTQFYMLIWLIIDNSGSNRYSFIISIVVFIGHNLTRIAMTTLATQSAVTEVRKYLITYLKNYSNSISDNLV